MKSRDMKAEDAKIKILELTTPDEILFFIEGDNRKGVITTADERLKELGHNGLKHGQTAKFTDTEKDFKGSGVEGKKEAEEKDHVTCEDVIERLRAKGVKI
ncbi:MAG: hypothetical protein GXP46_01855 [Deferribacteres bacterium]|nr:hypothetical protein [Deferribacteres bacterium]